MSYFERNHIEQTELLKNSFVPSLENAEYQKDSFIQKVAGFFKKKYGTLLKKVSTVFSPDSLECKTNTYDYAEFVELPPHEDVILPRKDFMTDVSSVDEFLKKTGVAYARAVESTENELPSMESMYEKYYGDTPEISAGGVIDYCAKTNEQIVELMKEKLEDQFTREQKGEIYRERILLEKQFAKEPFIMDQKSDTPGENINTYQVEYSMKKLSERYYAEKFTESQSEAVEHKTDLNTTPRPDFDTAAGIKKFIEDARNTFIEDASQPELLQYNKAFEKKLKRIEEKVMSMEDTQRVDDNIYNTAQSLYATIMGVYNTDPDRVLQIIERTSESPEELTTWYAQNKD